MPLQRRSVTAEPRVSTQSSKPVCLFEIWLLEFLWGLEVGAWSFFQSLPLRILRKKIGSFLALPARQ
jgi:hypothetical protein